MEAVIWLENYLSKWERILLLVSHSQDFLNNVCSHMIHLDSTKKKLEYYNGNYDTFVKTKEDDMINQLKKYKWEQEQIKSMKEYVSYNKFTLVFVISLLLTRIYTRTNSFPSSYSIYYSLTTLLLLTFTTTFTTK